MYDSIAEEIANEVALGHKKQLRTYMGRSYEKKPKHMKNWVLSKEIQKSKLEMPDWAYTHLTKPKHNDDSGPNTNGKSMLRKNTKVH